jgi:hypothetical protein
MSERTEEIIAEANAQSPYKEKYTAYTVGYLAEWVCLLHDELESQREKITELQSIVNRMSDEYAQEQIEDARVNQQQQEWWQQQDQDAAWMESHK